MVNLVVLKDNVKKKKILFILKESMMDRYQYFSNVLLWQCVFFFFGKVVIFLFVQWMIFQIFKEIIVKNIVERVLFGIFFL